MRIHPLGTVVTVVIKHVFNLTVNLDGLLILRMHELPRRAVNHPAVRVLHLVPILKRLAEKTEFVIDAVADGREIERSQRVQKTGRQTTQAPITEAHIVFGTAKLFPVHAQLGQSLASLIIDARVLQVADEQATHEILEGKIIEAAHILVVVRCLRLDHSIDHPIAHGHRGGQKPVARRRGRNIASLRITQMLQNRLLHCGDWII